MNDINNIFVSPNGHHAFICGEKFTLYYNYKSDKLKNLIYFKDITITSVAWNIQNQN